MITNKFNLGSTAKNSYSKFANSTLKTKVGQIGRCLEAFQSLSSANKRQEGSRKG